MVMTAPSWRIQVFVLFSLIAFARMQEQFNEELWLRPVPRSNRVISHFEFSMGSSIHQESDFFHYKLLPKLLGEIIYNYNVIEMKLTFTTGRWNYEQWGKPISIGPFGAELWGRFHGNHTHDDWRKLKSQLSGVFCASLNTMDDVRTLENVSSTILGSSYEKNSPLEAWKSNATGFYGTLPREATCSENLTPWLKLLPCRTKSGFGPLINSITVVSSDFSSIGIHLKRQGNRLQVIQSLTFVSRVKDDNWSLRSLFLHNSGKTELKACPLAQHSRIYTEINENATLALPYDDTLEPLTSNMWSTTSTANKAIRIHRLDHNRSSIDMDISWILKMEDSHFSPMNAKIRRYLTGYGQIHGGIAVHISNNDPKQSMYVTYLDNIPWFLRLYFHTMKMQINGNPINPFKSLFHFNFKSAIYQGHPALLELSLELPPLTEFLFSIQFEKVFLALKQHPPDANRGFDVPSGIATFYIRKKKKSTFEQENIPQWSHLVKSTLETSLDQEYSSLRMYSTPLLAPLPTPDFSMPYNVITLSSTVIAFFLGTMLNTLLRRKRNNRLDRAEKEYKKWKKSQQQSSSMKDWRIFRFFRRPHIKVD